MTEYELKVLRHIAGSEEPDSAWGAAMSVAIESLHGSGYIYMVNGRYVLTRRGVDKLNEGNHDHS